MTDSFTLLRLINILAPNLVIGRRGQNFMRTGHSKCPRDMRQDEGRLAKPAPPRPSNGSDHDSGCVAAM